MSSQRQFWLGCAANARGKLGVKTLGATDKQMAAVKRYLSSPTSYSDMGLRNEVICIDDRLSVSGDRLRAPRLAGGGLCLVLMHDLWDGGSHRLGVDLSQLRHEGFLLATHGNGCGALKAAPQLVPARLVNPDAQGYALLRAMGIDTPDRHCARIARWAFSINERSFDSINAKGFTDSEPLVGGHRAVGAAVCKRDGYTFVSEPQLAQASDGLLVFAFDPWAADRAADRMDASQDTRAAMALLGKVFTAEVLLELGGPDLLVNVFE